MTRTNHIHFFSLVFAIIVVNQVTKYIIVRHFLLGETITFIPGFFNLTYIRDISVAFGMFAYKEETMRVLFPIVLVAVILALLVFYFRLAKDHLWPCVAVSDKKSLVANV